MVSMWDGKRIERVTVRLWKPFLYYVMMVCVCVLVCYGAIGSNNIFFLLRCVSQAPISGQVQAMTKQRVLVFYVRLRSLNFFDRDVECKSCPRWARRGTKIVYKSTIVRGPQFRGLRCGVVSVMCWKGAVPVVISA